MAKVLNIRQTWFACLDMWKQIIESGLGKYDWLNKQSEEYREKLTGVMSDCHFCNYNSRNPQRTTPLDSGCAWCPGVLVDKSFNCFHKKYSFERAPAKFYQELLKLNPYKNYKQFKQFYSYKVPKK